MNHEYQFYTQDWPLIQTSFTALQGQYFKFMKEEIIGILTGFISLLFNP